jgi:hypothetical protein
MTIFMVLSSKQCKKKHPISAIPVTFRCQCCHDTLRRNKIKILFRKKAINLNIKWQLKVRTELVKSNITRNIDAISEALANGDEMEFNMDLFE